MADADRPSSPLSSLLDFFAPPSGGEANAGGAASAPPATHHVTPPPAAPAQPPGSRVLESHMSRWLELSDDPRYHAHALHAEFRRLRRMVPPARCYPVFAAIERDVGRTFSAVGLYDTPAARDRLRRLLALYAMYDEEVGYVQSMNFIGGFILLHAASDMDAFVLLVRILQAPKYNLRGCFTPDLPDVELHSHVIAELMKAYLPNMWRHLTTVGVLPLFWFEWYFTLYTLHLPLPVCADVWDAFLADGWVAIYRVMLVLMRQIEPLVLGHDFSYTVSVLKGFQNQRASDDAATAASIAGRGASVSSGRASARTASSTSLPSGDASHTPANCAPYGTAGVGTAEAAPARSMSNSGSSMPALSAPPALRTTHSPRSAAGTVGASEHLRRSPAPSAEGVAGDAVASPTLSGDVVAARFAELTAAGRELFNANVLPVMANVAARVRAHITLPTTIDNLLSPVLSVPPPSTSTGAHAGVVDASGRGERARAPSAGAPEDHAHVLTALTLATPRREDAAIQLAALPPPSTHASTPPTSNIPVDSEWVAVAPSDVFTCAPPDDLMEQVRAFPLRRVQVEILLAKGRKVRDAALAEKREQAELAEALRLSRLDAAILATAAAADPSGVGHYA